MAFQTKRPQTAREMIDSIKQQQATRASNRSSIMENAKLSKRLNQESSVLESVQAEQNKQDLINKRLDKIKAKRNKEVAIETTTVGRLKLLESAKKSVMDKVLFEMVYDAYWLDDAVKESTVQEAYETYKNTMSLVESVCGKSKTKDSDKTKFVKSVEEAVNDICEKAASRIIKDAKETGETNITFDLSSEDEIELDKRLSDLGRDEIVSLVRDKVLSVVQDEKESGKEKAAMIKEINDSLQEDEGELDDNTVGESVGIAASQSSLTVVEEGIVKNIVRNIKENKKLNSEARELLNSIGSSLGFKEEAKIFREADKNMAKKNYDEAIKIYNDYVKAISSVKSKIKSAKGPYSQKTKNMLINSCDMEISATKQYIEVARDRKNKNPVKESVENLNSVTESIASVALTAAVLGTAITVVALSVKDKIDLKKALKLYEKKCNPSIKMSELTPTLYEIDSAHRVTNRELTGVKRFFNKHTKRAKVWKDKKGHVICTAILYTTTDVGVGAQVSGSSVSPTVSTTTTLHYLYDVDSKYKKDGLYLSAMMAYLDNGSTDNTKALTEDMKKAFPEEFKNTKVKLIGKSLEGVSPDSISDDEPGSNVDVIIRDDEDTEPIIMECISERFIQRDCARRLVVECGAGGVEAEAVYTSAIMESDPMVAIDLFKNYKSILSKSKANCIIANSEEFPHEVKSCVREAINKHQEMCDSEIKMLEAQIKSPDKKSPDELLEQMKLASAKRSLTRSNGNTLFGSLMMKNTVDVRRAAVTEGISIAGNRDVNAALIESILQYTVMETLNTMKLYNFTNSDISKLRTMSKSSATK